MIDWLSAARWSAELGARPDRLADATAAAVRGAPSFRNTDFPLSPLPLFAEHVAAAADVPVLERYVALLGRIVTLYRDEPEIRQWYGLSPAADALIAADRILGDVVPVCRLDGYLEQGSETLRLLENNADAPAGTLFTARVNAVVRDLLAGAGVPGPAWSPLTYDDELALLGVLLDCLRRSGVGAGDPRVAVLQFAGRANQESHQMVAAFRAAGVHAVLADPRDLRAAGDRVRFGGEQVDVCWNKVNTVAWAEVEADRALVERWVAALSGGAFVHVNPFGARYVAESKFTLALTREPRFAGLFSPAEHELVDRLLPWARRLTREATGPDGRAVLLADLLDRPSGYVIKEPYDIRGDGVTVGRGMSCSGWEQAVGRALDDQLVVQAYVPPSAYPVLRPGGSPPVIAMPTSFDTFVLGGKVRGFGAKASLNPRLNVFQGGQKIAVHVSTPAAPAGGGPA